MQTWTVISDPATGLLLESRHCYRDATYAYRDRPADFRPMTAELRAVSTHDGCTVGENAAYLTPGEWMASDGVALEIGGPS